MTRYRVDDRYLPEEEYADYQRETSRQLSLIGALILGGALAAPLSWRIMSALGQVA